MKLPEPYYEDDWTTIYHGDCLEIVPLLPAVDVVLTDPPYGIGLGYSVYDDTKDNLNQIVAEALPVWQAAAPVVAFTPGVGNVSAWPAPTWVLCWYMANACSSTGKWGFNQWQPIFVYGTDPFLRRRMGRRPDVIITAAPNNGRDKKLGHPCPKPIEAWRKVVARVSPSENDFILDPMMGSGTTLEVCKNTGRKSIGIDIDESYCEIAAGRLSQEILPL